jgi:general stress protein YciG
MNFKTMDPARLRAIGSLGGKAAHADGAGRQFSREEAIAAGRLGGLKISADREHMRELGRRGGAARRAACAAKRAERTLE